MLHSRTHTLGTALLAKHAHQCSCRIPQHLHEGSLTQRSQSRIKAEEEDYFDEGAAQVKRLLNRDRKELKRDDEPAAEYDVEFERPQSGGSASSSASSSSNQNGSSAASRRESKAFDEELSSLKNPMQKAFKSPPKKGAFGSSSKSPFGSDDTGGAGSSFQKDMWANMEPVEENEAPWWTQISIAQVVIVFSFVTIISLMLATTWVTVKLGGVHFNE